MTQFIIHSYSGGSLFVIIVYDVEVDRLNAVRVFLKQYLFWVQNSVFEGDLTKSQFEEVINGLSPLIDETCDSIIIYSLGSTRYFERIILGVEKGEVDNIL
jgi:CRISPR-associated protein Cas2